jgi:YggT family protein
MLALVFSLIGIIVQLILVVSWLIAFEVVDRRNNAIASIYGFTQKLTEPMLRPIRRLVGPVGGIDLAPLILGLGLIFGFQLLQTLVFSGAFRG